MKSVIIMGVPVSAVDHSQIPLIIDDFMNECQCNLIMTPNPEMVMEAQRNEGLMKALNASDLVLADGIGLVIASKIKRKGIKERVTGIDTMDQILSYCHLHEKKIFLLGGKPGTCEQAALNINQKYANIKIVGTHHGYFENSETEEMIKMINLSGADALFAGLGFPKQEIWISENQHRLNCKLAMGVGGSLDVYAGNVKRAPLIFQKIGLEWFYRLIKEPWRVKRMAVLPQFLWEVLWR
ncbi:N-acetylmannosaminyltransferase [Tindallia magadiensis]|uniref:N-acetylglucosaminyldiphosphoundecaprenol N-acetyl-beta-D-mannosaminyltransferase n=1 Tax=Tindallia magadiensis TaxID=69895 RepID=A0A1I3F8L4_9FIRM|nr:WecB/TagA/CpsF family glycosyltransferase [Tindallia magadiensis]SFI07549.1 N-acetylmannosaminyltransferase [Tindallia magadiensis]